MCSYIPSWKWAARHDGWGARGYCGDYMGPQMGIAQKGWLIYKGKSINGWRLGVALWHRKPHDRSYIIVGFNYLGILCKLSMGDYDSLRKLEVLLPMTIPKGHVCRGNLWTNLNLPFGTKSVFTCSLSETRFPRTCISLRELCYIFFFFLSRKSAEGAWCHWGG